jgi:hypothetical protein
MGKSWPFGRPAPSRNCGVTLSSAGRSNLLAITWTCQARISAPLDGRRVPLMLKSKVGSAGTCQTALL